MWRLGADDGSFYIPRVIEGEKYSLSLLYRGVDGNLYVKKSDRLAHASMERIASFYPDVFILPRCGGRKWRSLLPQPVAQEAP